MCRLITPCLRAGLFLLPFIPHSTSLPFFRSLLHAFHLPLALSQLLSQPVHLGLQLVHRVVRLRELRAAAIELFSQRLFGCLKLPTALFARLLLFICLLLLLGRPLQLFLQTQYLLLIVYQLLSHLANFSLLFVPRIVRVRQLRVAALQLAAQLVEFLLLFVFHSAYHSVLFL